MIIFSPPSLHKYFRLKKCFEDLSKIESVAQQRLGFDGHEKAFFLRG